MALLHIGFSVRNCEQSFEEKDIHNFWFMLVFFLLAITVSWRLKVGTVLALQRRLFDGHTAHLRYDMGICLEIAA